MARPKKKTLEPDAPERPEPIPDDDMPWVRFGVTEQQYREMEAAFTPAVDAPTRDAGLLDKQLAETLAKYGISEEAQERLRRAPTVDRVRRSELSLARWEGPAYDELKDHFRFLRVDDSAGDDWTSRTVNRQKARGYEILESGAHMPNCSGGVTMITPLENHAKHMELRAQVSRERYAKTTKRGTQRQVKVQGAPDGAKITSWSESATETRNFVRQDKPPGA